MLPTVANQVWYALPSTLVFDLRATCNLRPLDPVSLFALDRFRSTWETETTASGGAVPSRPTRWLPVGLTLFAIWPADATGGNSLAIDGVRATPSLSALTDYVDLGAEEESALLGYALHVLTFKLGGARFQATFSLRQAFLQAALDQNDRLRASTYFRAALGGDKDQQLLRLRVPEGDDLATAVTAGQTRGTAG